MGESWESVDNRTSRHESNDAVIQAVLLYGSESCVLTTAMEQKLNAFHHRSTRYITRQHIRENPDGSWTCPSSKQVLETAGLFTIREYIKRRKNTIKTYLPSRPIYQKCISSKPLARNGNQSVWWCNQQTELD
jgi:hypothetical protein